MLDAFIKDKDLFKVFIDQLDCPLILLSEGGCVEVANNLALDLLHLDSSKYTGINFEKHCLNSNSALSEIFNQNKTNHIEESYTSDEKALHILWKIKPFASKDNQLNANLLIGYDITEYKAVSEELNNKIFFYESILSKLPTNVYWKDINGVYLGCNERLAKVMGLPTRDAIKGMTDFDFSWSDEAGKRFVEFDKKVMQSDMALTTEDVFEEAGGKSVSVLTNKTPLKNEAGDIIGVLAISVDITELKQTQEKLEIEKQKALIASKSKSTFIANMSHDLRTPITGMLGMIQDMLNTTDQAKSSISADKSIQGQAVLEKVVETVQRDAQFLMSATDELLQLCNEVLEVVCLESGKADNHVESFELNELIHHTLELLQPTAQHKKIELNYDVDEDLPRYLKGSRNYLGRILLNLVSNGLKFTEKGKVEVCVRLLTNDTNFLLGQHINLQIQVKDTGIGIPEDKFDEIFEHFSRLTPSYEGLYKGAGLGLYTVKRYIEAMKGVIGVSSDVGSGTSFTMVLPFTISDHTDRSKKSARFSVPAKLNTDKINSALQEGVPISTTDSSASILVVEDTKLAAVAVALVLKTLNCHVDIAHNGSQAVKKAKEGVYDLILMDVGLPDFSGIEATKEIRQFTDPKKSQVPIIALTGHANNPEMHQEIMGAGMQDVMSKPAQPLALESILQMYVYNIGENKHQREIAESMSDKSESLTVIDWDASVRMCNGDPEFTHEMISILDNDLNAVKKVLAKAYTSNDIKTLQAELHRVSGGVCYLRLPELELALKVFHEAVNQAPQDTARTDKLYDGLMRAIDSFKLTWKNDFNDNN